MPKKGTAQAKFKVGEIVYHRKAGGMPFQVLYVLPSVPPGDPSLYGCVRVYRYAEDDLVHEGGLDSTDKHTVSKNKPKPGRRKTKFQIGDNLYHRNRIGGIHEVAEVPDSAGSWRTVEGIVMGQLFQVVEIFPSVSPVDPPLYGCVRVYCYAEKDLVLEGESEQTS